MVAREETGVFLVAGDGGVDGQGPGVDAAGDVADGVVAVGAEILGHAQAAAAVVAVDQEVFVLGQRTDVLGNLAHGDVLGAGDAAGFHFGGFAHVDEDDAGGAFVEEALGFFNGEFERVGVGHVEGKDICSAEPRKWKLHAAPSAAQNNANVTAFHCHYRGRQG